MEKMKMEKRDGASLAGGCRWGYDTKRERDGASSTFQPRGMIYCRAHLEPLVPTAYFGNCVGTHVVMVERAVVLHRWTSFQV
uniref:Uncharacterized protein n=1 Tax=Nelumbo nucifera TaxID=4432 RepID=A0A822XN19_NELNU|nr:TPA_asm: hypothetical protein HUJ06_021912 [Nelumbo nucifera]